jgi:hypothetical protein
MIIFYILYSIYYIKKKYKRDLVILGGAIFILKLEDIFTTAETCSCYVLLINYILCNKVALENKIIYFIKELRGLYSR